MTNAEELERNGYRKYDHPELLRGTRTMWQKMFRGEKGVKYAINIWQYDRSATWEPEAQFHLPGGACFNVTYLDKPDDTIAGVEAFFEKVFRRMECVERD